MYLRDIPRLPIEISRSNFVNEVFELGTFHQHGYHNIIASVQLGDFFVNYPHPRTYIFQPFTPKEIDLWEDHQLLLTKPCPQFYSIELAHVVTVIISKFNEDYGYHKTFDAISNTENRYIIKLEYEICNLIQYQIKIYNFITIIYNHITDPTRHLDSFFLDFSKYICLDPILLSTNPYILLSCSIYLHQKNKLSPFFIHNQNNFITLMTNLIIEFDLDPELVIKQCWALTGS